MSAGRTQDALHTVTGTGQAEGMTFSGTKNFTDKWAADPDIPLVITLHGGTYTSAHFDDVEFSLLNHAATVDISVLAVRHGNLVPRTELPNITGPWNERIQPTVAKITVPVCARQGKFDRLWITDDGQIRDSGPVDTRLVRSAVPHRPGPDVQRNNGLRPLLLHRSPLTDARAWPEAPHRGVAP